MSPSKNFSPYYIHSVGLGGALPSSWGPVCGRQQGFGSPAESSPGTAQS